MDINLYIITKWFPLFLEGFKVTISVFFVAAILSVLVGILVATLAAFNSIVTKWITRVYITVFRNIPLLVLLFFLFYGLPGMGITLSAFWCGVTGIVLNESAFIAEILRGNIQSIDKGNWEGGYSVALSRFQILRHIILPQALRDAIPAVTGQVSIILKDTPLLALIMVTELTNVARKVYTYDSDTTGFIFIAVVYIAFYWLFNSVSNFVEPKVRVKR